MSTGLYGRVLLHSAWKEIRFEVGAVVLEPKYAAHRTCDSEPGVSSLWMLASSAVKVHDDCFILQTR